MASSRACARPSHCCCSPPQAQLAGTCRGWTVTNSPLVVCSMDYLCTWAKCSQARPSSRSWPCLRAHVTAWCSRFWEPSTPPPRHSWAQPRYRCSCGGVCGSRVHGLSLLCFPYHCHGHGQHLCNPGQAAQVPSHLGPPCTCGLPRTKPAPPHPRVSRVTQGHGSLLQYRVASRTSAARHCTMEGREAPGPTRV